MPNETTGEQVAEIISTPLEELIVALGSGIGRAQSELDRHSIEIQKQILEDPVLSQYGLEATWYQIPKTDLELKIALAIDKQYSTPTEQPMLIAGVPRKPLPKLWAQPVNARYANLFSFDVQLATTVKLSVVTVPPPGSETGRPTLSESEVLADALPYLFKDDSGNPQPRVTVNFNSGARAWYIIQTSESDDTVQLRALVKVDDETGNVTKHTGGPEV
jgi:hypothetical protein